MDSLRKKRSHIKGLITKQGNRIRELEALAPDAVNVQSARSLQKKLDGLDSDFKQIHYDILEHIDESDEAGLEREQEAFMAYDDQLEVYTARIEKFISAQPVLKDEHFSMLSLKLRKLKQKLRSAGDTLSGMDASSIDHGLLHAVNQDLDTYRKNLQDIEDELYSLKLTEDHDLFALHKEVDAMRFERCRQCHSLSKPSSSSDSSSDSHSSASNTCKLRKLEIPTFSGSVMEWDHFWRRFLKAVHENKSLTDDDKWEYLSQALIDGNAKDTIAGFTRATGQYQEAIKCLTERYHRPREVVDEHTRALIESPPLKEGDAKELRRLHTAWTQHIRALENLGHKIDPAFLTSVLQLKLDKQTNAQWKWESRSHVLDPPKVDDLLLFLKDRATTLDLQTSEKRKPSDKRQGHKPVSSLVAHHNPVHARCVLCTEERHPLYVCEAFKSMSQDEKRSTLKTNNVCFNCLRTGHPASKCNSSHRCKKCQRLHHTLLHLDYGARDNSAQNPNNSSTPSGASPAASTAVSNAATAFGQPIIYMTCKILVTGPQGISSTARALIDTGAGVSFITERLANALQLPRTARNVEVCGISGQAIEQPATSTVYFKVSPIVCQGKTLEVTALVLQKITRDLPTEYVALKKEWAHLKDLPLADPTCGMPGRIDVILGSEILNDVMRQGRRCGPQGSPVAWETEFGWVLSGAIQGGVPTSQSVTVHLATISPNLDILRRFWETEEAPRKGDLMTPQERAVVQHFQQNHRREPGGRFIVPLPKKPNSLPIGESREQALKRFNHIERSLHSKGNFSEVDTVIKEYLELGHAEPVPVSDLNKRPSETYYMPIHVVYKQSSTTTKVRAVFDASAMSSTGISLNDTLQVGPTVHPPLLDVLIRFRSHRIAITADVSKMYRAVGLTEEDKDFHRFLWRSDPEQKVVDYRMTRAAFGVAASCFAANMAVKQNAMEREVQFPLAAKAVKESFYVDDGLTGADSVELAIRTREELQELFQKGCFALRKWNSSSPAVLETIPSSLRDTEEVLCISGTDHRMTTTLGVKWDSKLDVFHIAISDPPRGDFLTKRQLLSDISRIFDVLGWFAPCTILMKIQLQKTWESGVNWDDPVSDEIMDVWSNWRSELNQLSEKAIPRCYYPQGKHIVHRELHGFCDASEKAYSGVVYLRLTDSEGKHCSSIVVAKTKVAPIRKLTIPKLELCGAALVTRLIQHASIVLEVPTDDMYLWTDSTIVISWLSINPRKLKTYVANRVADILEVTPPGKWRHVKTDENPADCASRGILPSQLINHPLWWQGPQWMLLESNMWPKPDAMDLETDKEELVLCIAPVAELSNPVVPPERYSKYSRLIRVTAWVFRFIRRCKDKATSTPCLTVQELSIAEAHHLRTHQQQSFGEETSLLKAKKHLPRRSTLSSLLAFLDEHQLLRVGGRIRHADTPYDHRHPIILSGKTHLAHLIIREEHVKLLHAGPGSTFSSLSRRFHIVGGMRCVRSVTRACVICRRYEAKPEQQLMGQLPKARLTPGPTFGKVGVDYAGPLLIKMGHTRKPTIMKAYVCVFVCMTVKAVHLELVTKLTSEAFIAALRRFVSRRGLPSDIYSDHGTNFIGANREIAELYKFLNKSDVQKCIIDSCSNQGIQWHFIPETAPHFGGLWEAAVKSFKKHLRKVAGDVKLTYEELSTILTQVEACLNSRPIAPMVTTDGEDVEALTPGHFLIGRSICALPDLDRTDEPTPLLRRWHLSQQLVQHFWKRWINEYLTASRRVYKWKHPQRNIQVGDVVVMAEDGMKAAQWPIGRVQVVYPGKDGHVRVARIKNSKGSYTRPITKLVVLDYSK